MNNSKVTLTKTGKEEIQNKISKLQNKVAYLTNAIDEAISRYGMHDEQYHDRLEHKQITEAELTQLQVLLENSSVMAEHADHSTVALGCRVQLLDDSTKNQREYQVVDTYEADPLNGKVSIQSPLGKSLMGKALGETVRIISPAGTSIFQIESIF